MCIIIELDYQYIYYIKFNKRDNRVQVETQLRSLLPSGMYSAIRGLNYAENMLLHVHVLRTRELA